MRACHQTSLPEALHSPSISSGQEAFMWYQLAFINLCGQSPLEQRGGGGTYLMQQKDSFLLV